MQRRIEPGTCDVRHSLRTALLCMALLGSAAQAGVDPQSPLGTNLTGIADFSDEFPFVDMMKASRQWIPGRATCFDCRFPPGPPFQNPDCDAPNVCPTAFADVDADGYIRSLDTANQQKATSAIYADGQAGRFPVGDYTMLYDGDGTISFLGATVAQQQPGRIVFNVTDANPGDTMSFFFTISALAPGNHIRNIRIYPPGGVCANDDRRYCDAATPCGAGASCLAFAAPGVADAQVFHPRFLKNSEPYRLLRYMDWMGTNFSPIVDFADYPTESDAFWDRVPPGILAALGNRLRSDIWITVPHRASNGFIDQFAARLRDTLAPERRVYVEYSNELWNGVFDQHREVPRAACPGYPDLAAGCQDDGVPGNGIACELNPVTFSFGNAGGPCFDALLRRQAERSVEIFDRFDAAFGASARQRVVRVVAAQSANPDVGRRVLVDNGGAPAAPRTDVYAIAPYFGNEYCGFGGINPDTHAAVFATADTLLDHLIANSLPQALASVAQNKAMLVGNGLSGVRLVAYEGGQHLARTTDFGVPGFPPGPTITTCETRFDEVNSNPRMGSLYTSYLEGWHANGGDEFVHFYNAGRWGFFGRWGALEFQAQVTATSAKYTALTQFVAANPCWWPGCSQDNELVFANGFE